MEYWIKVEPSVSLFVHDINPSGKHTILFLHGWPANHEMFEYQYDYFTKHGYRCIGVDMRGFGKSDKPMHGYHYDRLADDVRQVIDALHLSDITLAGHSTGGSIAIRYMARHGGYGVAKLALFAAAAPSLIERPNFPYGLKKEDVFQLIDETNHDRPAMLETFGSMFFFQQKSKPFTDWFQFLGLSAAIWSTTAIARAWLAEELFDDFVKILVPTLILHGKHDKVCLFPLALAQKKGITHTKLVPFECSGHGLLFDERDKFNEELLHFTT